MAGRRTLEERARYRSLAEASEALGLSPRQLKRRIAQGVVGAPHRAEGGRYLFTPEEVEEARATMESTQDVRSTEGASELGNQAGPSTEASLQMMRASGDLGRAAEYALTGRRAEAVSLLKLVQGLLSDVQSTLEERQ